MERVVSQEQVEWTEVCSVGIPSIDREHRHIFTSLNRLATHLQNPGARATVIKELTELENQVRDHFTHEEHLLEASGYPEIERQKAQHRFFQSELRFLRLSSSLSDTSKVYRSAQFLGRWFLAHIASYDGNYKAWLKQQEPSLIPGTPDA